MSAPAASAEITITLPDGKTMQFPRGVTGNDIAARIGPGLAKAALILEVNGQEYDLFRPIEQDAQIRVITKKDEKSLELIRHDAAHLLAMAVQELYPGTQVTIGPAIEDGFYYDFARNEPFTPEDLPKIEEKMREIVKQARPTRREVWPRDKAVAHFRDIGESYKAELIQSIPANEDVSIYWHGDWHDLCRGPHFRTTAEIGDAFKLTKIAGAYWRGDSKNAQLQRIYGTAWRDKKELDAYLQRLEEAEKRDHRKLGREMNLFHMQEEAVGQVFWHPDGHALYRTLEAYIRRRVSEAGYQEIKTPLLFDRKLWEQSGHWATFHQNMFIAEVESENKTLAVKPMNCPGHIQVFKQGTKLIANRLYRLAEFARLATAMSPRAPCMASCGCVALCRTMRTSSAPMTRSPPRPNPSANCCCAPIATWVSTRCWSSWPPARKSASVRTRSGTWRKAVWKRRPKPPASISPTTRAKAPFTAPSWNLPSPTPSAANGNAAPCRWTSTCPNGWAPPISAKTAASIRR